MKQSCCAILLHESIALSTVGLNHLEQFLLLLLVLIAALAVLAKRIQVPYPIVLVIAGLFLGFIPALPQIPLRPEVVFLVFLPPLLFTASFHISWRDFRENLVSIVLLAFGLVGFTLYGAAITARWLLPGFNWQLGLVLGAVVSTTDPLAATSTARRLGLPRRIVDLLEAESLVNDGSGLLALRFTSAIVVTGIVPSFFEGAGQLFYLITAGVLIGILAGMAVRLFQLRVNDAPIEITISLIAPYLTYFAAEAAHCSGVLATIACGLYLGRRSSGSYSLHARIESSAFWRTLDFILNGMVFLLLGLQLPSVLHDIVGLSARTLAIDGALFSAIIIVLRLLWVYPGAWISALIRRHLLRRRPRPFSPPQIFLVGWAGMRGVLALAAAMSLPIRLNNGQLFPQRSLIIFLTFCVIVATLVFQGLTMPALIRLLGLGGSSISKEEELGARREMIAAALQRLEEIRTEGTDSESAVAAIEGYYRHEQNLLSGVGADVKSTEKDEAESRRRLAGQLRSVERTVMMRLRNEDQIHDEVLRTLERELDLLEARFADPD